MQKPAEPTLKLTTFTTDDGLFVASQNTSYYCRTEMSSHYLINGKEMTRTHHGSWFLIKGETEIKTIQEPFQPRKEPDYYILRDESLYIEGKIPKTIKYEDVNGYWSDDNDEWTWGNYSHIQSLYVLIYKQIEGGFKDVSFEVTHSGSVEGSVQKPLEHKFKISGKYQSDDVEKALKDVVTYSELEKILTPEFLLHEKPCSLPSKQFYNLIRAYVKDNIDKEQARVTSDYDFCFTVKKLIAIKPYEIKREQYKANGKSYRTPKFTYSQVKNEEVTVFEMTNTQDRYKGYSVLDEIKGESLQDLYDNITTYLNILMEKINKPIKQCDCCKGVGYMLNSNN